MRLPHKIALFYSNRQPKDAAFLAEFQAIEKTNPNFRLIATMTAEDAGKNQRTGETRMIDAEMIKRYIGDMQAPIYYCAGPAGMVTAMQSMLTAAGVAAKDIRTEEFYGY